LDSKYSGLVFSLDARFYSCTTSAGFAATDADSGGSFNVTVESPQFLNSLLTYQVSKADTLGNLNLRQITGAENKFIESCLHFTLKYLSLSYDINEVFNGDLSISIYADNDFYSQDFDRKSLNKFSKFQHQLNQVRKTGLGSSAALTTSLIASILTFYLGKIRGSSAALTSNLDIIHNLSQFCHAFAQGKVGSGFDVCAAVFGNQVYSRFNQKLLNKLLREYSDESFKEFMLSKFKVNSIQLPAGLKLMLIDVQQGSSTPKMVSKLLKWREDNIERADVIWEALNNNNLLAEKSLRRLAVVGLGDYSSYLPFEVCFL
jgi:phosphomevalonate kinase